MWRLFPLTDNQGNLEGISCLTDNCKPLPQSGAIERPFSCWIGGCGWRPGRASHVGCTASAGVDVDASVAPVVMLSC